MQYFSFLVGSIFSYVFFKPFALSSSLVLQVFIGTCIIKIIRHRESNIQEFSVERLLQDDDADEDDPLIQ